MNDTVLTQEQIEVVSFCMKHGMLATAHVYDKKLVKETCARVNFNYDKWHKEMVK